MKQKVYQTLIELTNGKWSSVAIQKFAKSSWSRKVIPSYIRTYGIQMQEVSQTIESFPTLHDFFIRKIDAQHRPIAEGEMEVGSPVDAKVESIGQISSTGTFLVKEKSYILTDLLGNVDLASQYVGGTYMVLYLSPADYHRIHSPVNGHVKKQMTLGKKSYPVNQAGLSYGKTPISGNYRQVTHLICPNQKNCAVISVGAMFVNSIEMTNTSRDWIKGEEIGYFTFGSTVVLLFGKDAFQKDSSLTPGSRVRVGEKIGSML
ncbi:phosphatidylserine decarboxylase [Paenisporosarcina sp. HGH0030]|uniref:phosphatidylserine decarboxylase n=1 Tax=Paenisporosarcina sp. HGH0030 TaxID=1078085 RepID=UPI00034EBEFF|nr:phosphatidylserine decarboxylase [Paenisporosarcina sp. HGH0030]EPD54358.1 phosphatidylserine decarboxylase [Paenisporosarcina sp. HGH0030]